MRHALASPRLCPMRSSATRRSTLLPRLPERIFGMLQLFVKLREDQARYGPA